jgi:hypothetical protein
VTVTRVAASGAVDRPDGAVAADDLSAVRALVVDGIAGAVSGLADAPSVEVTLSSLRRTRTDPGSIGAPDEEFAWKPVFVRRSLGLAAVRACVEGRFRAPSAAVGPLADEAVDQWRRTGWRSFHWEPWFAGLGGGARAVVLAEAVTWASALWVAFDWEDAGPRARFGGADDLWTCPGNGRIRLKGRCEIRLDHGGHTGLTDSPRRGGEELVSVSSGLPGDAVDEELAFLALVAALCAPDRPVPLRVRGLWPDAGERHVVDVDLDLLRRAAERVVACVAETVDARTPRRQEPAGRDVDRAADPAQVAVNSSLAPLASGLPAAVSGISATMSS